MPDPYEPLVYLVGAGPGDPGLLTLRAKECLGRADFVLYDQLVPPRILGHVRPGAEKVCVRDLPGEHPQRWPHIARRIIAEARAGRVVVRLKGGDPLIFGRGGEEAELLRAEGIPYEIVPGITAAVGAAAYAEVPLTHRADASAVAFVTGHEFPGKEGSRLDWEALARFPGTLAIYMGVARLGLIAQELIRRGVPPQTPAVIVQHATTGHQHAVAAELRHLDEERRRHGIEAPAVVLIGPVAGRRPERSWFERRPLVGRRVLVTRPAGQEGEMVRRLEQLGAIPYHLPTVEIREPADWSPVDAALDRIRAGEIDWLVFTSVNGVRFLLQRLRSRGRDLRDLGGVKLAAIGPGTAGALREYHLEPDVVPAEEFRAERLAEELRERVRGQKVLLARADRGREVLRERLAEVAAVEQVTVYAQVDAIDPSSEVFDALRRGEIDFVTLTSSNIARSFLGALDETIQGRLKRGGTKLVSISPVTSEAVRALGYAVAAEAEEYTSEGVIRALVGLAGEGEL